MNNLGHIIIKALAAWHDNVALCYYRAFFGGTVLLCHISIIFTVNKDRCTRAEASIEGLKRKDKSRARTKHSTQPNKGQKGTQGQPNTNVVLNSILKEAAS